MAVDNCRPEDLATIWFARLEKAKEQSDFEAAVLAQRQLKRLGVVVTFEGQPDREACK